MGPAVSRPDDLPALAVVVNVPRLQWGRPFHGRMASLTTPAGPVPALFQWSRPFHRPDDGAAEPGLAGTELASMGPAVSRPDEVVIPGDDVELQQLQWGRPFHGRMTASA